MAPKIEEIDDTPPPWTMPRRSPPPIPPTTRWCVSAPRSTAKKFVGKRARLSMDRPDHPLPLLLTARSLAQGDGDDDDLSGMDMAELQKMMVRASPLARTPTPIAVPEEIPPPRAKRRFDRSL